MQTMIFKSEIQSAQIRQHEIEEQKTRFFKSGGKIKTSPPLELKPMKARKVGINTNNYFQLQ